jgi:hypothetical protein
MPKTWQEWIDRAWGAGWKVQWREDVGGYVYVSPRMPRRPSEDFGWFSDERAAWRAAANSCRMRDGGD